MRLTPSERDRLLIFTAAELARQRLARGLRLNVPEATALIADTVCEAAREGRRLSEAVAAGQAVLGPDQVLPGVREIVGDVKVEAVFEDGTRLAVVTDAIGTNHADLAEDDTVPGAIHLGPEPLATWPDAVTVEVTNTSTVPISVTSHFHFFEANPRLPFDRAAAYGRRLAIPAGSSLRFGPASRAIRTRASTAPNRSCSAPTRGTRPHAGRAVRRLRQPGRRRGTGGLLADPSAPGGRSRNPGDRAGRHDPQRSNGRRPGRGGRPGHGGRRARRLRASRLGRSFPSLLPLAGCRDARGVSRST